MWRPGGEGPVQVGRPQESGLATLFLHPDLGITGGIATIEWTYRVEPFYTFGLSWRGSGERYLRGEESPVSSELDEPDRLVACARFGKLLSD